MSELEATAAPGDAAVGREPAAAALGRETLEGALGLVVDLVCARVTATEGASAAISTTDGQKVVVASESVRAADALQHSTGRGPAPDVLRTSGRQHLTVESGAARWPEFTAAALDGGFRTVLALPFTTDGETIGALTLYSPRDGGFGPTELAGAETMVAQVSRMLAGIRALAHGWLSSRQLEEGLATRGLIGQAQGILMSAHGCGGAGAFAILRERSQAANRRLHQIAAEIVAGHEEHINRAG